MVSILKIKRGGKTYYYLEHSIRSGPKVYKKRKYLGKLIPSNIVVLKERLIEEVYMEKWYPKLKKIKNGYESDLSKTPKSIQDKNMESFMVRFTYDTQRIEGSKLSLRDTGMVLIDRTVPRNAKIDDVKEAENHKKVFYSMLEYRGKFNLDVVLKWHKLLFADTKQDMAGKIRDYPIMISNSDFVPPKAEQMDRMLSDFFGWYEMNEERLHPVKLAALAHLKFVTIHPFGDGNGRISRIILNYVLKRFSYPMIDIKYANRYGYYRALERSQVAKDERIFSEWFFKQYVEQNKIYIEH